MPELQLHHPSCLIRWPLPAPSRSPPTSVPTHPGEEFAGQALTATPGAPAPPRPALGWQLRTPCGGSSGLRDRPDSEFSSKAAGDQDTGVPSAGPVPHSLVTASRSCLSVSFARLYKRDAWLMRSRGRWGPVTPDRRSAAAQARRTVHPESPTPPQAPCGGGSGSSAGSPGPGNRRCPCSSSGLGCWCRWGWAMQTLGFAVTRSKTTVRLGIDSLAAQRHVWERSC